ncbi:MAG: helix-turn-helix domain-containing protein [Puniceicoccales bacterium]|jgi:transposase|nr:helix-turn-helix domain-containing protein [Puniceicoccales bacterium]
MRILPRLTPEQINELEIVWSQKHDERCRRRLQVLRLVAQGKLIAAEIAQVAGVSRPTVFNYIRKFLTGGTTGLLSTGYASRRTRGRLNAQILEQLRAKLEKNEFKHARDVQEWLASVGVRMAVSTVFYWVKKINGTSRISRRPNFRRIEIKPRSLAGIRQ